MAILERQGLQMISSLSSFLRLVLQFKQIAGKSISNMISLSLIRVGMSDIIELKVKNVKFKILKVLTLPF